MSYAKSAARLHQLFTEHDYEGRRRTKAPQAVITVATLSNGSTVQVAFPGYKQTGFDYRVELVKNSLAMPLSHMNIILDLVNKCEQGMDADALREALEAV